MLHLALQQQPFAALQNVGHQLPAEHRRFVEAEMVRWAKVIKAAGEYAE